jgi:hypothetical protein
MESSIRGDAWYVIGDRSIELVKWFAFVLMLLEHASFYVFDVMPPAVFIAGRSVFPLFAIALALGLRSANTYQLRTVVRKLLTYALIAAGTGMLVGRDFFALNVLFTFAIALYTYDAFINPSGYIARPLSILLLMLVGPSCEFGIEGIFAVVLVLTWARYQTHIIGHLSITSALVLISIANGFIFSLFAWPLAVLLSMLTIQIPRIKGFFYWGYALQFVLFYALRTVL